MDRYNNPKNTAPEVDPTKQKKPLIDKSDFDLGRTVYFRALDGMIIPFDHIHVLPNSQYEISYNIQSIMTNPYVKQLLSGKRAYVHVYHSNFSDLWEGAPEFFKKGRDFNTNLEIPHLDHILRFKATEQSENILVSTISSGSPAAYLGLPVNYYDPTISRIENIKPKTTDKKLISDYSNLKISCLPLVMYQQIYQAHYLNKNLVNNNTNWLPQVENHFILPLEASGRGVVALNYDISKATSRQLDMGEDFDFNNSIFVPRNPDSDNPLSNSDRAFLNILRFRQFKGDMFTAGSPFPDLMRGDVPVMSFSDLTGTINWNDVIGKNNPTLTTSLLPAIAGGKVVGGILSENTVTEDSDTTDALKTILSRAVVNVQNQLSFNLNALRALDVYTLLGERAARTDGTYNDYIKTMFGVNPNYHMHEPRYLGGFYLDFVNQSIEQTSESNTTPLGTTASKGATKGSGYIGKFSFNDHGYIMAVLDIVDETVYTDGIERDWTDLIFEDQYLPLFNGLSPQATKQQELHITGVKADNEDVFNYVERYSHLKSRRNKALGQMSLPAYDSNNDPIDIESASYLHTRQFKSKIEFNNLFVTMTPKNIDMTPYTASDDYPFLFIAQCNNQAILPLPYITVPSGLSIMA